MTQATTSTPTASKPTASKTAYTPEQTAELVQAYVANPTAETVQEFAEKFGKTSRSLIAKLAREGVYQKKEYTTKTGAAPVKKDSLADDIGAIVGLSENEADSLAKANKTALQKIMRALRPNDDEESDD